MILGLLNVLSTNTSSQSEVKLNEQTDTERLIRNMEIHRVRIQGNGV